MQQLTPEQLNKIIETINDGKYSWACVLMLRALGENPLHHIPQRTYSRLLRENQTMVKNASSHNRRNKRKG